MLKKLKLSWVAAGLDRQVRKHGWTGVYVGDYSRVPSWTYSIGFDETLNQPEVVIFDVPQESANEILWQVFNELKAGELRLEDGAVWHDDEENAPIWRKVDPSQIAGAVGWLTMAARRRYKRSGQAYGLEAFQLVLPDPKGRFPWDAGYDEHIRRQQPALYLPENDPDAPEMNGAEREARRLIGERGWTVVPVDGPELCWAYSIGFAETLKTPDVIAFGPDGEAIASRLIEVWAALRQGELVLEDGLRWSGLGFEVCWRRVHESHYVGLNWFYVAKQFREARTGERAYMEAFQMFVPDLSGLYPWEEGCEREMEEFQPQLFLPFDPARLPSDLRR